MIPLDTATIAELIKLAPAVLPEKKRELAQVAEEAIRQVFGVIKEKNINAKNIKAVLSALSTHDIEITESRVLLPPKKITIRIKKTE